MGNPLLDFPVLITGSETILGAGLPELLAPYFLKDNIHTADMQKIKSARSVKKTFLSLPDFYRAPDRSVAEKNYIHQLLHYVKENRIRLIIPASGFDIKLLAASSKLFEELDCLIFVESPVTIDTFFDKYNTIEALKAQKLPALRTWLLDLSFNPDESMFPLIAKPRFGYGSQGIYIIRSKKNFEHMQQSEVFSKKPYIVQEYIGPPTEEYSCSIVYRMNGSPLSIMAILRKKLDRITLAAAYNAHCHIWERKILEFADRFGGTYCLNLQFVTQNGEPYIFEINPRFGTAEQLRAKFGQNAFHLLLNEYFLSYPLAEPLRRYGLAERDGTCVHFQIFNN